MRDYWGEPSGEPRPDYRDAVEPVDPIEHEGKPARGQRIERPADDGYQTAVPDLLGALRESIEKARALRRRTDDAT
jgi:hypothetical protein